MLSHLMIYLTFITCDLELRLKVFFSTGNICSGHYLNEVCIFSALMLVDVQ